MISLFTVLKTVASPSSRGRGLKYVCFTSFLSRSRSPSSRGRGLKLNMAIKKTFQNPVALFTRAWIEIEVARFLKSDYFGRPFHEGVD